jgi:hypothetical protein
MPANKMAIAGMARSYEHATSTLQVNQPGFSSASCAASR